METSAAAQQSWEAVSSFPALRAVDAKTSAALGLHKYLTERHWNGQALVGPDVGVRFNYRLGRFIKSYLPQVSWKDDYCYVQAQGYWILANWDLFRRVGEKRFRDAALRCSQFLLSLQREDGAWIYPNREWRGRIATAEGTWGALGLIESYRQTGNAAYLTSAQRWYGFLIQEIGFQRDGSELAINYFHGMKGPRVPNNSAFVLRFLAELADAAKEESYRKPCAGLLQFLQSAQLESGELPYTVRGESEAARRTHFQCYQYNAFSCLDLIAYYELRHDAAGLQLIRKILGFLRAAIADDGHSFFACGDRYRQVTYHTAVLAQAFEKAAQLGLPDFDSLADRAYANLLRSQRPDGGFDFSRGDYRILRDRRSYPRNLAMILYHLLPARHEASHQHLHAAC